MKQRSGKSSGLAGCSSICKVFFIPPVVIFCLTLWAMYFGGAIGVDGYQFYGHQLSGSYRLLVFVYFTVRSGAMFLFVYYLHCLLGNYSRNEIFTSSSASLIRRWGFACILWGIMKFLFIFLPGVVPSQSNLGALVTDLPVHANDYWFYMG